ncbi:MAG: 4-hydroxythreonine-4-phosphate dehydrogenase PdxA, partial [bacterium]|nr:4-hydroxythreonine-4-phosphate dehydrogenase PdxA [bacterium]
MHTIALTPGCPAGIGPELFPVALSKANIKTGTKFIWCGSVELFEKHANKLDIKVSRSKQNFSIDGLNGEVQLIATLSDNEDPALNVLPGQSNDKALISQKNALLKAVELAQKKQINAIVTGPIRKAALSNINGKSFPGQTELLHYYLPLDNNPPLMCFAGYDFILGLVSVHVQLKNVSTQITKKHIEQCIARLTTAAAHYFANPNCDVRLTVLGLNPHAGENGLIGDEELKIISPTISKLKKQGVNITGPLAADGFFSHLDYLSELNKPHAVLAMYHDQGLIPYKI